MTGQRTAPPSGASARPVRPSRTLATPTMKDVAAAAGVSRALVSIVFRNAPGASEATREHVFRVATELGYRTNRTASMLKLRHTRHLGVAMDIRNAFQTEMVASIQQSAGELGYQIVLSAVTPSHEEAAVETLLEFRCEAVILLGSGLPDRALAALAETVPVVLVGRRTADKGLDVVRSAEDLGQQLAVDHLAGLGHRDIAHVDGGRGVISSDRRRGYRTAMRRNGLADHLRLVPGGVTEQAGYDAASRLLEGPLPTAVTAFNDHCALGVITRLARAGVAVPADVSVTGYDDTPFARFMTVDLTTVSQDAAAQGALAVRAAVGRLEDEQRAPEDRVLLPRLVVRGTTAPLDERQGPVEG